LSFEVLSVLGGVEMVINKRSLGWGIIGLLIFLTVLLISSPAVQAQYWVPLPPYNLLWPLWSPALSPPDPVTGVPTPILGAVTTDTFLPQEPILLWDPALRGFPYMLYNIPEPLGGGVIFFDLYFGLNKWPPSYLIDPITLFPAPISLPSGFAMYPPPPPDPFQDFISWGNQYFLAQFPPGLFNTSATSLLTTAEIWGLPPLI
jgi:hypothetical protein